MEKNQEWEIVYNNSGVPIITEDGYVEYDTDTYKCSLVDKYNKKLSNEYFYMEWIGNDNFIVCDVTTIQTGLAHAENFDESKLKYGYGVIRINRDENGNILPMQETIVVPKIYDMVTQNNLNTVTVEYKEHYSYVDLDIKSQHYGKQLVPCRLERAVPFNIQYEGFAECSIDGVAGYLPRNCYVNFYIRSEHLLTKEQVEYLINYWENNYLIHDSSTRTFENLTEGEKTLKLKIKK